jgi:signal transduction histidine kinase/CheY-like chemotaxis protein/HPt (histidine-containing phosphotransfer) domain-containing protein
MKKDRVHAPKIKLFITIGYVVLLALVVYGVVRIYSELMRFSKQEPPFNERKELVMIGNVLSSLYESETLIESLFTPFGNTYRELLFDSLQQRVVQQMDSLKSWATDPSILTSLDSVSVLLEKKFVNIQSMIQLSDSLDRVPFRKKSITTILSQKKLKDLIRISKMYNRTHADSVHVQVRKKTLMKRLSDVFKSEVKDSVYVKRNSAGEVVDSILPITNMEDTISKFLTDVVLDYDKKREMLTAQLVYRQSQLHQTNNELTSQINTILNDLEIREYEKSYRFLLEKEHALSRSSGIVFNVALAALITAAFFLILSLRSISRELKYQRELEASKKHAEDLMKNREQLMLTISHDIKTPLSSVIGYIELLDKSNWMEKDKYYLQNMRSSSEHVLELLNKLLDYHRLESGNFNVQLMSFSPYRLFEDIHRSFIPLMKQKNLRFEFVNELDKSLFSQSDPLRIRQIVNNLISNAIKFTCSGKVRLEVSASIADNKHLLQVIVKDTGIGINPIDIEKIFETYHRADDVENLKIDGSGLGLAISKKLTSLLEGSISVVSERGKGSEFTVIIPLKEDVFEKKDVSQPPKNPLKILLVDDDSVLLNMYSELLKRNGFVPLIATRSTDALALLQDASFDIVFTDIQMPDMNGFELVERIRMSTFPGSKDIPIIALSARSDISEQKFIEAGFSGFLAKPVFVEQMMSAIAVYSGIPVNRKKEISGNGLSALTAFAGKDKEAATNIIETFVKENANAIETLEKAVAEGDWSIIRSFAHKLLPLMRMIKAEQIVSILCDLENDVREEFMIYELVKLLKQKNQEATDFMTGDLSV